MDAGNSLVVAIIHSTTNHLTYPNNIYVCMRGPWGLRDARSEDS
jgi:hypothetical protein